MTRYGRNQDGTYSPCRAKPENVGRYNCTHGEHVELTPQEAMAMNEAVTRANAMKHYSGGMKKVPLEKADEYVNLVNDLTKQSGSIYDNAMNAIRSMESDKRFPVNSVSELLPTNDDLFEARPEDSDPSEWRNEISQREIKYMMTGEKQDLAGRALIGDESRLITEELGHYAQRNLDRRTDGGLSVEPTPAEERALTTLMANPLAGNDKTTDEVLSNGKVMEFGARFAVSSPYLNDDQKAKAFKAAPECAIESQSLDSKHVNKALEDPASTGDGSKLSQQRLIRNSLRHPNVDPDLAYRTMRDLQSSSTWNDVQKNDFDWQLAMNPNPNVARRIAELDNDVDYEHKLTISKNKMNEDQLIDSGEGNDYDYVPNK